MPDVLVNSRVWPSGAARAAAWCAMMPDAPGMFSTTTGCPRRARDAVGQQPRHHVGCGAGSGRDDQLDGTARPGLRLRLGVRRRGDGQQAATEQQSGQDVHGGSLVSGDPYGRFRRTGIHSPENALWQCIVAARPQAKGGRSWVASFCWWAASRSTRRRRFSKPSARRSGNICSRCPMAKSARAGTGSAACTIRCSPPIPSSRSCSGRRPTRMASSGSSRATPPTPGGSRSRTASSRCASAILAGGSAMRATPSTPISCSRS